MKASRREKRARFNEEIRLRIDLIAAAYGLPSSAVAKLRGRLNHDDLLDLAQKHHVVTGVKLGLALRTGGTIYCRQRNSGREVLKLSQGASLMGAQHSVSPVNAWRWSGHYLSMLRRASQKRLNSRGSDQHDRDIKELLKLERVYLGLATGFATQLI